MSNQDSPDNINPLEDQQMNILNLFNKRIVQPDLKINFDTYLKIYDALCCSICLSLVRNPVYSQCSHRFCKQCIQKCIRLTDKKKSCPNCRSKLSTKRDLHIDYNLIALTTKTFGDLTNFRLGMDEIQKNQVKSIKSQHSINRLKSKRKTIKQGSYNEQSDQQQISQTNEVKNIRKARSQQQQKVNMLTNSYSVIQQSEAGQQSTPKKPKRGAPFKSDRKQTKQQKKMQKQKQKIEEKKSRLGGSDNQQETTQKKNIQYTTPVKKRRSKKRNGNKQIIEITSSENQTQSKKIIENQVQQAKKILQQQLGQNYQFKMLRLISDVCIVQICLKMANILKDNMDQNIEDIFFRINLSFKISGIIEYAQRLWDFEQGSINVNVASTEQIKINQRGRSKTMETSTSTNLITCLPNLSILQINQFYWKSMEGIEMAKQFSICKPELVKNKSGLQASPILRTFYIYPNSTY